MTDRTLVIHCKAGKVNRNFQRQRTNVSRPSRDEPVWCRAVFFCTIIGMNITIRCKRWGSTLNNGPPMANVWPSLVNDVMWSGSLIYSIMTSLIQLNKSFSPVFWSPMNKIQFSIPVNRARSSLVAPLDLSSSAGLSYTVSSSDHRIQYQSFDILMERDTTIRRELAETYSVLHANHKHFIPPSHQQCRIPLEEDILIEIFLNKTKRGKPVRERTHQWKKNLPLSLLLGEIVSLLVQHILLSRSEHAIDSHR